MYDSSSIVTNEDKEGLSLDGLVYDEVIIA